LVEYLILIWLRLLDELTLEKFASLVCEENIPKLKEQVNMIHSKLTKGSIIAPDTSLPPLHCFRLRHPHLANFSRWVLTHSFCLE
jgi:hypothetical protein